MAGDVREGWVVALARAVLAASKGSPVLPAGTATVVSVEPGRVAGGGLVLRVVFERGGRRYEYRWPERAGLDEATIGAAVADREREAHVVLSNLAELLESRDHGLAWAVAAGLVSARDAGVGRSSAGR